MARGYATIDVARNRDPDWIALSVGAKAVYDILTSQPDIQACGVLPLTLRRWSTSLNDADRPRLSEWLNELVRDRFVVVDKDSEELLVRTFVKWDHGYKNAKRRMAIISSANAAHSRRVREALRVELAKVGIADCPDPDPTRMNGRSEPEPTETDGPSEAHASPTDGPSMGLPSGIDPPRLGLSNLTNREPGTGNQNPEREPGASPPEEPPTPWCSKHDGGTDEPCRRCAAARVTRDQWDTDHAAQIAAAKRAAQLARQNCPDCQGDVWLDDGTKCTHPNAPNRTLHVVGGNA